MKKSVEMLKGKHINEQDAKKIMYLMVKSLKEKFEKQGTDSPQANDADEVNGDGDGKDNSTEGKESMDESEDAQLFQNTANNLAVLTGFKLFK